MMIPPATTMRQVEDINLVTPERLTAATKRMAGTPEIGSGGSSILAASFSALSPLQQQQLRQQHCHQSSSASSTSSITSSVDQIPASPTFSLRQSARFSSANSSIAGSPVVVRSSLDGFNRMPLLTEEVQEEKEGHQQDQVSSIVEHITYSSYLDEKDTENAYDWVDTPPYEGSDFDFVVNKRRCGGDGFPDGGASSRLTERFPSIAKKFKSKREKRTSSLTGSMHEAFVSRSRASSLRSQGLFDKSDIPPTPPAPIYQEPSEFDYDEIMQLEDEEIEEEQRAALSRTPLLPPVLAVKKETEPIQSPLQSPTVDATPSLPQSPFDSPNPFVYLPSPPLSTRPSIASFHHRSILPSAEIPIINLADTQDEWSIRLGHGNFTITPEPYQLQAPVTLASCQKLKADWDLAKKNFNLHLVRTEESYNKTSKVYHLTLVKWADINLQWRTYYEQASAAVPKITQAPLRASFSSQEPLSPVLTSTEATPMSSSIASLGNEAKFPTPAAGGIVGPMEKVAPPASPRSPRKRSFWKFLQGVWPSSGAVFGTVSA